MFSPNSYAATLMPNVTVFGDKVFKEIIKVKRNHKAGAKIRFNLIYYMEKKHIQNNHISVHLYVLKPTVLHGMFTKILEVQIFLIEYDTCLL